MSCGYAIDMCVNISSGMFACADVTSIFCLRIADCGMDGRSFLTPKWLQFETAATDCAAARENYSNVPCAQDKHKHLRKQNILLKILNLCNANLETQPHKFDG